MGRKSSIDKLTKEQRAMLAEMLNDPACTLAQIAQAVNDNAGERVLSASAMQRYKKRMDGFQTRVLQARSVAEMYLERCGADSRNKLGKVINEQIRLAVFDLMLEIDEIKAKGETSDAALADIFLKVSKSLREIEQAEKLNAERTESIRRDTLAEAAEAVEASAKSSGLSAETIGIIKKQILGL